MHGRARTPGDAPFVLWAMAAGTLVLSCGPRGRDSDGAAALRRLDLRPVGALSAEGPADTYVRIEPSEGIAPWSVETEGEVGWGAPRGASAAMLHVGTPRRLLPGEQPHVVLRIPGTFDPGRFDRLHVTTLAAGRTIRAHAALSRAGAEIARSQALIVRGQPTVQSWAFAFPGLFREREPLDEIAVEIHGARYLYFGAAELRGAGPGASTAGASAVGASIDAAVPKLVYAGAEGRRAVILAPGRDLECTLSAAEGAFLRFAHAWVEEPRENARLRIVLEPQRGAPRLEVVELAAGEGWREHSISLAGVGGGRLHATFVLDEGAPLAAIAEARLVRNDGRAPAILLVTSDTHRGDHVGAASLEVDVRTPHLDELASRGVLFERAWSTTNRTIPSHSALMTGVHPRDTRIINNRTSLAGDASTLAEAFSAGGFATYAVLSSDVLSHGISGLGQGFDRLSESHRAVRAGDQSSAIARKWLDQAVGEPVFLWLHLFDAHGPYAPPQDHANAVLGRLQARSSGGSPGPVERRKALYRGEVEFLDRQLGELLSHARLDGAIVAVTGDHGESLDLHGLPFCHKGLYPDTVHVPMILAWPGAPRGRRVAEFVSHIDLGRTLLELAEIDTDFPGQSLLARLDRAAARPAEPIFAIAGKGVCASLTLGPWHLILHLRRHSFEQGAGARTYELGETELFDLGADRHCQNDLLEAEFERAGRMRAALIDWLGAARDPHWASVSNLDREQLERLSALGYGSASPTDGAGPWFDPALDTEWNARFR